MSPSLLVSSTDSVCPLVGVCVTPEFLDNKPIVNRPVFMIHQVFVVECQGYNLWSLSDSELLTCDKRLFEISLRELCAMA